jgi:hypothetical protein
MTTKKNVYCWHNNSRWTAEIVLHPAQTGRTRKEAVKKVVAVYALNPAEIKLVTQTAPR